MLFTLYNAKRLGVNSVDPLAISPRKKEYTGYRDYSNLKATILTTE